MIRLLLCALTVLALSFPARGEGGDESVPERKGWGIQPPSWLFWTYVVEYVDDFTGDYVLLTDWGEMFKLDQGMFGPGWRRTGYSFPAIQAWDVRYATAAEVCRFYAPPPVNAHFFTASWPEGEHLMNNDLGLGYRFERFAFRSYLPETPSTCPGYHTPVYRLYNNQGTFGHPRHRYLHDFDERARMVAAGWIEEGVAFCF